MEKQKADKIIPEFLPKIYGFAYKKSFSYDEAEELAAEMTAQVYRSLLSRETVVNPEGYVWRICEHVYARYVSSVKKRKGLSLDLISDIPYYDLTVEDDDPVEAKRLRREIAYLSASRREIVFRFYYRKESVRAIAERMNLPEGTVKWHLNRAKNELKEGLKMERKIGKLGLHPVEAADLGHSGSVGPNGGPEYYLGDRLNLNIVYSVYYEPKKPREIAEELGVTPVFIEDKIEVLENNGYLVRKKDGRYTTYVDFCPLTFSKERQENQLRKMLEAAEWLVKEYVPKVRKAVSEVKDVYIPTGNRELLEAAAIMYAVTNKCSFDDNTFRRDLSKYDISDLDGGKYVACVNLYNECIDPDFKESDWGSLRSCGSMWRGSSKYPAVGSWSIDSRYDNREGAWKNNLDTDYEALYELMTGRLNDEKMNAEKIARLRERKFIDDKNRVRIMVCKEDMDKFFDRIPRLELDEKTKETFASYALEIAMEEAKDYPPQMQDLIVSWNSDLFNNTTAILVLNLLYSEGVFRPLTDDELVTADLIMFSDVLPE